MRSNSCIQFKSAVTYALCAVSLGTMLGQSENRLFDAVRSGDLHRIRTVLSQGVAASATNPSGQTALMLAVGQGRADIVRLLLDHHAAVDAKDQHGTTALIFASMSGHTSVIKELLKKSADVNAANNGGIRRRWNAIKTNA